MQQSSDTRSSPATPSSSQQEYSPEERTLLLRLAHDSIVSQLEARELSMPTVSAHLAEPRGAFTTLYFRNKLRGCVGYPIAILPLYRTVIETARAAAFDDPRFEPVSAEDARELRISLSVLSPLVSIQPEQIEVGKHGLVISRMGYRGLLLPQVAAEHGWDRITFLEQTCRKAGLPLDAWREGASMQAFTAEVFSDEGCEEHQ